jgi:hypothetical protein
MRIDLDAAAAARREAAGEAPVVIFGGKDYVLPVEFPLRAAVYLADLAEAVDAAAQWTAIENTLGTLFGDRGQEFLAGGMSVDDWGAFMQGVVDSYGVGSVGESQASPDS